MSAIDLRDYQDRFVDAIRAVFAEGHRSVMGVASTGAGKTIVFSYIADNAVKLGNRVFIFVHLKELIRQTSRSLTENGIAHGIISAGYPITDQPIQVVSIQTFIRRMHLFQVPELVIIDECFPAGTLVDGRPIESLKIGDQISSFDEKLGGLTTSTIVNTFRNRVPDKLIEIVSGEHSFVCTLEHPILTNRGWVAARAITTGDLLVMKDDYKMRKMRQRSRTHEQPCRAQMDLLLGRMFSNAPNFADLYGLQIKHRFEKFILDAKRIASDGAQAASILLQRLHAPRDIAKQLTGDVGNQSKVCATANERAQPDAIRRDSQKDGRNTQKNRTQAMRPWWQWANTASSSRNSRDEFEFTDGSYSQNTRDKTPSGRPQSLQGGYSGPGTEISNRSGWRISPWDGSTRPGCPKITGAYFVRVDRIEIHERSSSDRFRKLCPDGYVYNLEVERTHTYTANGFVVHNCHHSVSASFQKLMDWMDQVDYSVRLGVTATPARADGKGFTKYFDTFVEADDIRKLIADGWLVQPTIYSPPIPELDLSTSKQSRDGDFDQDFDALLLDRKVITGSAIEHYKRYLPDYPPTVVFCSTVQHAHNTAMHFTESGISSEAIDGSMDDDERSAILNRVRSGETRCLMSCNLVSEGFDLPAMSACIMLRRVGPKCMAMFMQMVGRVLRKNPGKTQAFIFDHVENTKRHIKAVLSFFSEEHRIDWRPYFEGRQKKPRASEEMGELETCPKCFMTLPVAVMKPICPNCGHNFKVKGVGGGALELEEVDGELVKFEAEKMLTFRATTSSGRPKQVIKKLERA